MANDDNQQYYITIPNPNGETIIITPEILPEQLLPLVQKKHFKDEKVDLLTSAYKKIIENLAENGSNSLGSITSLNSIINANSGNSILSIKQSTTNNDHHKNRGNVLNSSSSLATARSSLPTILLRPNTINQNNHNLQSSVSNEHTIIPGSLADNSNNYLTTLQISQSNSNLQALTFTQPPALLHYSNQNPDSPNTVLIPISLHNSNQFSQQQILVAAAAVASGGYSCNETGTQSIHTSNSGSHHNLSTTSLAKLISGNLANPLSINLSNVVKSNSANSDISTDSKSSTHKRKFDLGTTDEFGRRKEMRLLKNREAARECRRKKKEYVKCLENRVTNLEQQNKVLVDEINRMKELYSKKASKKGSNAPSECDNSKYMELYPIENLMKEYYDNNNTESEPSQHNKEKTTYVTHPIALTSIANMSLSSSLISSNVKYISKDVLSTATDTTRQASLPASSSGHVIITSNDGTVSQLADMLTAGNSNLKKVFTSTNNGNNSNYSSTTATAFPHFRDQTESKVMEDDDDEDEDDSRGSVI